MFPIERYLQPEEADPELIELYLKALLNQTVRPKWSPVMYMVAVHHVNRFMYLQDGKHKKLKKTILDQTLMIKHQVSIETLSYYTVTNILFLLESRAGQFLILFLPFLNKNNVPTMSSENFRLLISGVESQERVYQNSTNQPTNLTHYKKWQMPPRLD